MPESPSTQLRPTITVVQSCADSPLGALAAPLEERAHVRLVRPFDGDAIPDAHACGAGLVVLGGSTDALDDANAPWLPAIRALLADAVATELPTLATGLGAQLLTVACGGRVALDAPPGLEAGIVEVAWRPEAADDPMFGELARRAGVDDGTGPVRRGEPTLVATMHSDAIVELPAGATWLASSAMYPFHAFRLGAAVAVQFRPEADADLLASWARAAGLDATEIEMDAIAHAGRLSDLTCTITRTFVEHTPGVSSGMSAVV